MVMLCFFFFEKDYYAFIAKNEKKKHIQKLSIFKWS
jgi:hypothetical protein